MNEQYDEMSRERDMREGGNVMQREGGRRDFNAPLGEATSGRLEFSSGAANVTFRVNAEMPDLFRAHFEGAIPNVETRDGVVRIRYPHSAPLGWLRYALSSHRHAADVTLNGAIPWLIELHGGAARVSGDLRMLRLEAFEIRSGASHVELTLPPAAGTVPIRIGGGAAHVTLRRPAGVAARVRVGSGAVRVAFDSQGFGAIGGPLRMETPGYAGAADRYDIEIGGGAVNVTVDTL